MQYRVTKLWLAASIQDKALAMVRHPVKIGSIVVDEDNHKNQGAGQKTRPKMAVRRIAALSESVKP